MSKESVELEPVDARQCQAEIKEGSFMTFGMGHYVRCQETPGWLAVDVRGGVFYGAMSLCDKCKKICEIRVSTAQFQKLNTKEVTNVEGKHGSHGTHDRHPDPDKGDL